MAVEQRIGRIHRFGQKEVSQVYNLVAKDTVEERIYGLLAEKLQEIARAIGKVDRADRRTTGGFPARDSRLPRFKPKLPATLQTGFGGQGLQSHRPANGGDDGTGAASARGLDGTFPGSDALQFGALQTHFRPLQLSAIRRVVSRSRGASWRQRATCGRTLADCYARMPEIFSAGRAKIRQCHV